MDQLVRVSSEVRHDSGRHQGLVNYLVRFIAPTTCLSNRPPPPKSASSLAVALSNGSLGIALTQQELSGDSSSTSCSRMARMLPLHANDTSKERRKGGGTMQLYSV